jgi:hypothetical protein
MPDRKAVKKFFEYKLDNQEVKKGPLNPAPMIIFVLIGAVAGIIPHQDVPLMFGLVIIGLVVGYVISRHNVNVEYTRRLKEKEKNNREFEALARQVWPIITDDIVKVFLRAFERTQIDRDKLTILDKKFSSSGERDLLSEETLGQKLGDIMNKCLYFVSQGDFSNNKYFRWVRLPGEDLKNFFNPIRLILVFFPKTQLVICDVQTDCIDGNLREEIHRIPFPKIVNVQFTAERTRLDWDVDGMVEAAQDLGYDEEEVKQIRESFEKKDGMGSEPDWVLEEMRSQLFITRTDSGAVSFPIRTDREFGKDVGALDQANVLTKQEITVDRIVNEMNRLIEDANRGPSGLGSNQGNSFF